MFSSEAIYVCRHIKVRTCILLPKCLYMVWNQYVILVYSLHTRSEYLRRHFFRTGRVCNTTTTSKNKLDSYKIMSLQPPHFQSPNQLHALVTLLDSIGYLPIATASLTAIVLAHRGVAQRGDYLLKILTWYNFTKDLVKSFSFQLQPATQKPLNIHHINQHLTIDITLLYATPTHPSSSAQFAFLVLRSGSTDLYLPAGEGSRAQAPGTLSPPSPIARYSIFQ